jgi:gamma-glutamyltranspeptidase
VFDAVPHELTKSETDAVSLFGVFGYASLAVHTAWRETPEGKKAGEEAERNMKPAVGVPGIVEGRGYFHVHFQEG